MNGTGGADHGSASTLLLAGGALKPGPIVGKWSTFAPRQVFEGCDLAPPLHVRTVFKGLLNDPLGVGRKAPEPHVLPNSVDAAAAPDLVP